MPLAFRPNVLLRRYTTLKAGGPAQLLLECPTSEVLAEAAVEGYRQAQPTTVLGWGSNVLPSDRGVTGLVLINCAKRICATPEGEVIADTGVGLQELFLKTAQLGLKGLQFAVGIPGTLGGALVSNAGAYRSCISEYLTGVEVVTGGERRWVDPSWMQFSYRDSILRCGSGVKAVMLRASFRLPVGTRSEIFEQAKEFQRQRISKQPPGPSAGSFFKNVQSFELAQSLGALPEPLRRAGIVPAGYLIEAAGLKGFRHGGAAFGVRHANFILNIGNATATEIRQLAEIGRSRVQDLFGVALEEEVLYIGDWTSHQP